MGPIFYLFIFMNKVIVGPVNSAICLKKAEMRASKKKKRKENAKRLTQKNNSYPNVYIVNKMKEILALQTFFINY